MREKFGLTSALNHEIFDGAMKNGALVVKWPVGQGRDALFACTECSETGRRRRMSSNYRRGGDGRALFTGFRNLVIEQFEHEP